MPRPFIVALSLFTAAGAGFVIAVLDKIIGPWRRLLAMSKPAHGKPTFSLPHMFGALTAAAVVCTVLAQVPLPTLSFAIGHAPYALTGAILLAILPLVVANLVCTVSASCLPLRLRGPSSRPSRWFAPHRLLLQAGAQEPPGMVFALVMAIACTLAVCLSWPLIREVGLAGAIAATQGYAPSKPIVDGLPALMADAGYLYRTLRWELFAMARWWLLFGALAAVWLLAAIPLRRPRLLEPPLVSVRRLLAFAPWLALLEIAFLAGVWTWNSNVVPEPSTGFVEGIFSWNKWHWHGWLGKVWIARGLAPTLIVSAVFFRYVLRWRWAPAVAAAASVIPLASTLSIAWTVLYQHPEPLFGAADRISQALPLLAG